MALERIIAVCGPKNSGKSSSIGKFTHTYLGYERFVDVKRTRYADVKAVFEFPYLNYPLGIWASGDAVSAVENGIDFLEQYKGLRVMILACHGGDTKDVIERYQRKRKADIKFVCTEEIKGRDAKARREAAIIENARLIRKYLPKRD